MNQSNTPTSPRLRVRIRPRLRAAIAASGHRLADLWPGAQWLAFGDWVRELRSHGPGPSNARDDFQALHRATLNALARELGADRGRTANPMPVDTVTDPPDHAARLDAERVVAGAFSLATPAQRRVLEALAKHHGDREVAAQALGISPSALRKTLQRLRERISKIS